MARQAAARFERRGDGRALQVVGFFRRRLGGEVTLGNQACESSAISLLLIQVITEAARKKRAASPFTALLPLLSRALAETAAPGGCATATA